MNLPTMKQHSNGHSNHHHTHHTSMTTAPSARVQEYSYSSDDSIEEEEGSCAKCFFGLLYTISQLFLFGSVVLLVYFMIQHDEGFAWNFHREKQFNLHAVLMVTGFIFMNGQSMLVYKSFKCCKKIYNKILHTILFVCSISAITIGTVAGIQAQHNVPKGAAIKHFYSIHSWIGLTAIGLFCIQFIVGFISFLVLLCCDKATRGFRSSLIPVHRTFGLIIYHMSAAAALTGIIQLARYRLTGKDGKKSYRDWDEPMIIINAVGVCIIGLNILLPYIIRNCGQNSSQVKRRHASFHVN